MARLKCSTVELINIYHGRISKDGGISWKFASSLFEHPSDQIEAGGNHSDGSLWRAERRDGGHNRHSTADQPLLLLCQLATSAGASPAACLHGKHGRGVGCSGGDGRVVAHNDAETNFEDCKSH